LGGKLWNLNKALGLHKVLFHPKLSISTTLNLSQAQAPESATSLAVPGRPIGIVRVLVILQKKPPYLVKSTRSPVTSHRKFFEKNPQTLRKPTRSPVFSMGRPASMGQIRPVSLFSFLMILSFLLKPEISQKSYKITEKHKNTKPVLLHLL
jgi:hypothetical protein